jgi:transposase
MAKIFRDWDIEQLMMFPPSVEDFVPKEHLAHFVRNTVLEAMDLSAILDCYSEERGYPPYHPVMMTALLLYAYCQGIYPSRRVAKACQERVDFMAVTAMQTPDFRTISDFRKRHLAALGELFVQVLRLCQGSGAGEAGARGSGWDQGKSQRLQAQGHELRADEEGRSGTGGDRQ